MFRKKLFAMTVVALLVLAGNADERTWNGSDGLWSDATNWEPSGVPQAGDTVKIKSGRALLSEATPELDTLEVAGGTLAVSNWTTKIWVKTAMTIGNGGVVNTTGPFTNEVGKSRVWISCGDLVIDQGGKIDVSEQGWSGGLTSVTNYNIGDKNWTGCLGFGPGGGTLRVGASHGGLGGCAIDTEYVNVPTYDDATNPVEPGSGGFMKNGWLGTQSPATYTDADAAHGGGAVLIEAIGGTVTVNGSILANGRGTKNSWATKQEAYSMQTAGSGGSINITCSKIKGEGSICANGGNGDYGYYPSWLKNGEKGNDYKNGRAGGGGMIKISYDSNQGAADVTGMKISACGGMYVKDVATPAVVDKYMDNADLGTVYFTDEVLLRALYGKGLSGKIVHGLSGNTLELTGPVTYSAGYCRIPVEGFTLKVNGDLTIAGDESRLEVGGVETKAQSEHYRMWVHAGSTPNALKVTGSLTIGKNAALDLRASKTNGNDNVWGCVVEIGGNLTVETNAFIYCWSEPTDGGSVDVDVTGSVTIDDGGTISADGRGFAGCFPNKLYGPKGAYYGFGPGAGGYAAGGSHGGKGGYGVGAMTSGVTPGHTVAETNDYIIIPSLAGSGGGSAGYGYGGYGGGVIHLTTQSKLTVNGTISANGGISGYNGSGYFSSTSAGAGGTVMLVCGTFSGSGTISAKGGDGQAVAAGGTGEEVSANARSAGAGGGGRIAIWSGREIWKPTMSMDVVEVADNPISGMSFSGTATAAGGTASPSGLNTEPTSLDKGYKGADGTVKFCRISANRGYIIRFR